MDLNELLVFAKVAEAQSFTLAAKRLGMPKSTVSLKIAKLEERLGARLLHRTTRKLRFTEEGGAFYERCRRIIEDVEEAERSIDQAPEKPRGHIKITAPVEFGMTFLGGWIAEYLQKYSEVTIEVELTSRLVDIVEESFDLAIRAGHLAVSSQVARKLTSVARRLYASPGYLKRRGVPKTPQDLQKHTCLGHSQVSTHGWDLRGPHGLASIKLSHPVLANSFALLRDAAANNLGIVLIPDFVCRDEVRAGRLVRVLPEYSVPPADIFVMYPTRRLVAPRVRTFLNFIEQKLVRAEIDQK